MANDPAWHEEKDLERYGMSPLERDLLLDSTGELPADRKESLRQALVGDESLRRQAEALALVEALAQSHRPSKPWRRVSLRRVTIGRVAVALGLAASLALIVFSGVFGDRAEESHQGPETVAAPAEVEEPLNESVSRRWMQRDLRLAAVDWSSRREAVPRLDRRMASPPLPFWSSVRKRHPGLLSSLDDRRPR